MAFAACAFELASEGYYMAWFRVIYTIELGIEITPPLSVIHTTSHWHTQKDETRPNLLNLITAENCDKKEHGDRVVTKMLSHESGKWRWSSKNVHLSLLWRISPGSLHVPNSSRSRFQTTIWSGFMKFSQQNRIRNYCNTTVCDTYFKPLINSDRWDSTISP